MAKEILAIVEALSNEKALDKEKVFQALEIALATASKKKCNVEAEMKAEINRKTGAAIIKRRWLVVDAPDGILENPSREISLEAARVDDPEIRPGDYVEELIIDENTNKDIIFDRITAQTVKQVLQQQVREAERQQIIDQFKNQVGKVLTGTVKKAGHERVFVDLGNGAEAVLQRKDMLLHDNFSFGDHIRGVLLPIREDASRTSSQFLELSRTSVEFLKELLSIEVPEIAEGQVEIVSCVRDPGSRSKVAVKAKDRRIDAKGACVGMKGSRIKSVSEELSHEKVDIISYDDDFNKYVKNAMEPAMVSQVIVDMDTNTIIMGVDEENYKLAIGTNGQNVRLAQRLIARDGREMMRIKVMTLKEIEQKSENEHNATKQMFIDVLNIDDDFAQGLVEAGFTSIEEVAYVEPDEIMATVEGLDEGIVAELQDIARNSLKNITTPSGKPLDEQLIELTGTNFNQARALAAKEICDLEGLAELDQDELADILQITPDQAGKLIMEARNRTWFKDEAAK